MYAKCIFQSYSYSNAVFEELFKLWTYTAIFEFERLRKYINIFCLFSDLSSHQDLAVAILNCFSSPSEEIKSAASFALGLFDHSYISAVYWDQEKTQP